MENLEQYHITDSCGLRKSSCNYLRRAISSSHKLVLVAQNELHICLGHRPFSIISKLRVDENLRDLCWGPTNAYSNNLVLCYDDHLEIINPMPHIVCKPISIYFGKKISVTMVQWMPQLQDTIYIISSASVYKTLLSVNHQHQLTLSEVEEVWKGKFGAPGICLTTSGAMFYGITAPGACSMSLQTRARDSRKRFINAQSPPNAGNIEDNYEARAIDCCAAFALSDSLDGINTENPVRGGCCLAGTVNVFAITSEKAITLSTPSSVDVSNSRLSNPVRSSQIALIPTTSSQFQLSINKPSPGSLIAVLSSNTEREVDSSDNPKSFSGGIDTFHESFAINMKAEQKSGAFPHVLPGVSLREALAVPVAPVVVSGEKERNILDDLHNIHLNLYDNSGDAVEGNGSSMSGLGSDVTSTSNVKRSSPQAIISVGLIVEFKKDESSETLVLMSPALPLALPRASRNEPTATELSRPDVLATHIVSISTQQTNSQSQDLVSPKLVQILIAVGSSSAPHILLVKATCIVSEIALTNAPTSVTNRDLQWEVEIIEQYSLPDQMRCKGLTFQSMGTHEGTGTHGADARVLSGATGLQLLCIAAEQTETYLTSFSAMAKFSSRLVVLSLPESVWKANAESADTWGSKKMDHTRNQSVSKPSDSTEKVSCDDESSSSSERNLIGMSDVLAAISHMHSSMQARLDGIEARLETQQNSIALLTSEFLKLRCNMK